MRIQTRTIENNGTNITVRHCAILNFHFSITLLNYFFVCNIIFLPDRQIALMKPREGFHPFTFYASKFDVGTIRYRENQRE